MITAGIDSGSRAVKTVIYNNETGKILASAVKDQGVEQSKIAENVLAEALNKAGISRDHIHKIIATGYGRNGIDFADSRITEITCHAKGVSTLNPGVRTIIDIGGQDSKVIHLDEKSHVFDFVMNDRCAAGTGRFMEIVIDRLECSMSQVRALVEKSRNPATISSMCVVFAETEIIGLLAAGTLPEDILAGVQSSIATRLSSMAGRFFKSPLVFTGGMALVDGMKEALEKALGTQISTSDTPQFTGALGAAVIASE